MISKTPRVFISYSHDSPAHSERVLAFATALRDTGIEVELDQFHTDEIIDWPRWCNEQTSHDHSDFVLCVCTAEYQRRIEGKVPPEKGKGVYWEGSLLDDDLYDAKGNSRILPILFDGHPETVIPRFLRGWTFCRVGDFALSDSGYEQVIRILTGQASVVKNALGTIPVLPPHPLSGAGPVPGGSVKVAPTRLRHGAEHLFGREERLAAIDAAWNDPAKHVLTIVAWGGIGKTSLVVEWMARKSAAGWPEFEWVFDWSFYSQGTREQGAASADTFIAEALTFFGDEKTAQSTASPWDKGARLAQLVAQHRSLLVLDGLEPLQQPPGPLGGQLKDPAVATLLRGLAQRNPGLCVVTTRERVAGLAPFNDTTAPQWELKHLSTPAGVELLKTLGVQGTEDEFKRLVEDVAGHALTLQLLGRYLVLAWQGDIRKRDRVKFDKADAKIQGGHAFKTMAAYEKWLAEGGEDGIRALAVLRLLGLFDRPADAGCLAALRREPAVAGLTEPLIGLGEDDWNLTLSWLAECGLASIGSERSEVGRQASVLDAHPLIREYFAKQLRENSCDGWRSSHRRLYEHLKDSTKDKQQPTLEDLQPLYQAVAHGCQAGMYQSACDDVYRRRIQRDHEAYSTHMLGAIGADLGAVAWFFEKPWTHPAPGLSETDQAWLLNEAAFSLRALGRLVEAVEPMRASLRQFSRDKDWRCAAAAAGNLGELDLTLGDVDSAVRDAEQSVGFADRSGDAFECMSKRAKLADALHQSGHRVDALARFQEAEGMQAKDLPEYPLLYSSFGFQYCDLLLAKCERAAWRVFAGTGRAEIAAARRGEDMAPYRTRCREVEERTVQTLEWVKQCWLLDVALDHLTLGRAALYRATIGDSKSEQGEAVRTARQELTGAVDGLRRAGVQDYLSRGLLSRAWLRFLESDADGARADLDEAWQIAERGPMKLFMADVHLDRARLFCREKPYPWKSPREDLAAARVLVESCGYGRRKEELEDAEEASLNW